MARLHHHLLLLLLLLLLPCLVPAAAYKVLVLGPIGSRSLYHLCRNVARALGTAGHDVTLVASFTSQDRLANVTDVWTGTRAGQEADMFGKMQAMSGVFQWAVDMVDQVGHAMWTNPAMWDLWRDRHTFDAIIIIGYVNEVAYPFLLGYRGARVALCTPGVEYTIVRFAGHALPLAVTPSIFLPFDEQMTFLERMVNPLGQLVLYISCIVSHQRAAQRVVAQYFDELPWLPDLMEAPHLTLVNGHFAMDGPNPLLPNQVEVGTINARPPRPLPQDLEQFMAGSGDAGVIYFSLGSLGRSSHLPHKYKTILLEAFGGLDQRVVMKYEDLDVTPPDNVITRAWLPQQDVLGHPKTRLFISHCGNLGTQEAKYHGVPTLAVPIAFDQHRNAARLARKGYGVVLNWEDMTVESLRRAILGVINDERYYERLRNVSRAVRDQKESPGERAVWWVEYAIRHKDSRHLRYPGTELHFLQMAMLDVLLAWVLLLLLCGWAVRAVWRCVCAAGKVKVE